MDYMNVALQCINYILRNTSFRMEVYPNWPLFHGSLIKNCSVYEQWGGSEAQARKDIGKGLGGGHIKSTYKLNPAFAIYTFPIIHFVCVFLAPQHTQTVLHAHCLYLLFGISIVPREMKTMRMQNCLRVLGDNKNTNKVEIWKWRIVQLLTRTPTLTPIPHTIIFL